ncbi:QWRF motif-containing protein 8 [Hibiscus syriacus]|uniref:QWRF motif-containing protein 8 n=1 Tax=Hibiscus syriacus TaxID=106335 RepID=A0A6A3D114_HIBSY|nr:QWRF motif-containing protein 8 [Hibiscus syriacus]
MDVCKPEQRLHKLAAADPTRPPLVSAEKNNGPLNTRHSRTREVSSRHKSPTPSTPSGPRRCPSPTPSRTTPTPSPGVQKRAVSAERKRPATPPPLQITSTPVNDSSTAAPISSRRLSTGRIPDSLWPSTMRNLSVPFQSGTLSPVSKKEKEKPVSNVSLDRTLRPSSNVAHIKQSETSTLSRKPSPERKRSHLEGENAPDQSENAKPVDGLPSRLIDHHRWPSRIGGKLSSNSPNKSVDQGCKIVKNLSTPNLELSSLKRMPVSDSSAKPLLKSSNDAGRLLSIDDIGRVGFAATSIDDKPRRASFPASILSPSSLDKTPLTTSGSQSQSPRKTSVSRGVSPHLPRPSTPTARGASHTSRGVSPTPTVRGSSHTSISPTPTARGANHTSRGVSPTRMRTSTSSSQSHSSTPVLSPTPRVVSPTRMRTSTSSSQSHSSTPVLSPTTSGTSTTSSLSYSSTSVINSTARVVSPTRMRTSTSSNQSHSSTSNSFSQFRSSTSILSSTPIVVSPTQMKTSTSESQSYSSTTRFVSPPQMRTSTSSSQSQSSTSASSKQSQSSISASSCQSHVSTSILSSTPRVVSPIRVRTSSSSQSHSSTSVLSSAPRVLSPTRMRTSTSSRKTHSRSHSSSSVLGSNSRGVSPTPRGVSPTPKVVSPTRMRTSTSSSQFHSSTSVFSSTSRGVSPTPRGVNPTPRVVSPTRMRTSTLSSQSHSSTSVLSFVTDCKKGRKGVNSMEDAHQLRLLYNRYLQWRFANAHAEAVFDIQKVNSEETLYNVWNDTLDLCNALIKEKINLQWLKLELKLDSLLNHQMAYLDNWALLERDHISSLAGAEEDLEASTLLIPITGGAKADIESLKAAICSAVDVMQAMGSSICSLLPKVEGVNYRVSELAAIGAQEKNMLDQCEALLSSTAAMQLEECSLMAHLTQTKQPLKKSKQPTTAAKAFPWP